MWARFHEHRKELEAKWEAQYDAEENKRRNREAPFLKPVKYARHGQKWTQYECSACGHDLHRTARFCVECGAWFEPKETRKTPVKGEALLRRKIAMKRGKA